MEPCQIITSSKEHFDEVFTKLRSVGFVYSSRRCKTVKEINGQWGYYKVITIGTDDNCKMVLHGSALRVCKELPNTTVDEILKYYQQSLP